MTGEKRSAVIMLGPSLDSRGGMATVVNGYIKAGIRDICDFEYIETTRPGSVAVKALAGISAYARFRKDLPACDIVHLHIGAGISPMRKSLFAKAAKRTGKAVVIHEHRGVLAELYRKGGYDFAKKTRELYELADVAIVLSEEWKDFFAENVCDPSKVVVLHNSVPAPADVPALGREEKVLFLGHMTDVKGPDILVKAIPEVAKSHPACRFIFAGDGDAQPYRDLAEELGVLGSCEFVGWATDREKDNLLRAAEKFAVGNIVKGKVARMTDFGAFVELAPGVDALLHVSQISKDHVEKPADVLKIGQEIEAKVVDFNEDDKKISLSIKALEAPEEDAVEAAEVHTEE